MQIKPKTMKATTITTVLCLFALFGFAAWLAKESKEYLHEQEQLAEAKRSDTLPDWELLRLAIIEVESEGRPHVVNQQSGAYGLYQILPKGGYLCEYNRIAGDSITLDTLKSTDWQHIVFDVVQAHHNPTKDLKKALIVHNPNSMSYHYVTCYEAKVMAVYWKLKYEQKVEKR